MTVSQAALISLGLFLAGIVKGASGIGYSTFALPTLVVTLDLGAAMAVITLPVLASNLAVIRALKGARAALTAFWPMYAALLPGTAIGVLAFGSIDRDLSLRLLGCVTLLYVGLAVLKPQWRLGRRAVGTLRIPAGLLTGAITGMTGSQVVPLVPFVSSAPIDARAQVQVINVAVTIGSVSLIFALTAGGIMTPQLALVSALGVVPAIAGVGLGARIAARLSQQAFRGVMLSVLTVIAGSLIVGREALPGRGSARDSVVAERRDWQRLSGGLASVTTAHAVAVRQGWAMFGNGLTSALPTHPSNTTRPSITRSKDQRGHEPYPGAAAVSLHLWNADVHREHSARQP